MLLKMSLIAGDINRYQWLMYPPLYIKLSPICQIEVKDYAGWAGNDMQFRRFVHISAAICPESTNNKLDDKCHQIRYGQQKLHGAAKKCFIPRKELSFDEGVIPSCSQYNIVRQYNNSKLDTYRIDIFILANMLVGHNFIIHMDVYLGKTWQPKLLLQKQS